MMKTLSSLDAAFLYLETPEMPMHVGALHVFELPAGYKGRFVRDLRKHIASAAADRAGAAPQAVVDAAEPGQPGLGRRRARPEPAHRRDQAAEGGAHRRRHGAARGAGGGAAPGAARSQAAAVEVPRLRGPGAERARPQAGGDVQPAAPCGGRRPGRGGAGQRDPRRHARAARDRAAALQAHARRFASAWASRCAARWPTRSSRCRTSSRSCRARWARSAAPRGTALQGALANSKLFGGKGGAGNITLAPKTRVQRVGDQRPRLRRGVAAAGRAEGDRQGARGDDQRHGADGGVHRAAPLPRQEAHAAQEEPDRRGADLAAQAGRHHQRQPGVDEPDQPGHAHRRPDEAARRTSAPPARR